MQRVRISTLTPLALLVLAITHAAIPARAQGVLPSDLGTLNRVTGVDVSSDGARAVFTVRSIDLEAEDGKGAYRTHLHVADLEGGGDPSRARARPLTFGARSDGAPVIGPDGDVLAFARRDGERGQVWLLPLDGPGEARVLTDLEHGARPLAFFPGGQALLVASSFPASAFEASPPWSSERPAREHGDVPDETERDAMADADGGTNGDLAGLRAWLAGNGEERDPSVIARLNFQGERDLAGEMRFTQLFLVTLDGERAVRLTEDWVDARGAALSPDGARIAFVDRAVRTVHPDRERRTAIYTQSADGGLAKPLLDDDRYSYGSPLFVADGLGFTRSDATDPLFARSVLGFLDDFERGTPRPLTDEYRFGVSSPRATSTGTILFRARWQGAIALLEVDPRTREVKDRVNGPRGVEAFAEGGGRVALGVTSPENPSELFLLGPGEDCGVDGTALQPLSRLHQGLLAERELSAPVERWHERPDGTRVQYWVMEPIGLEPGKRAPVVLAIHGGPSAMWGPSAYSMWHEFQVLANAGYGIVFSNPRGSSGYGEAFQRANFRDWGVGPAGDVLGCLDAALEEFTWMDRRRLFVTGGSYAGYLTAWIVTQDHRFRAAVAQRGVYDLVTFYGEGNAWRLVELAFGGKPWDPATREILVEQSPFTHVESVRTPLLVMHASRDLRTGVSQSEMLYRALKDLGREVEYVRYPSAGHDLSRTGQPRRRLDRLGRILEFFGRYLERPGGASRGQGGGPPRSGGQ